ncbi:plasmid stability protein [Aquamicrobium lusatiense]|uniref:Plasmid stability protein n=1 Tax=Aquamicrobium lusatiense TaxID=89772 RepID=A0A7W9S235_9HYPH|nr:plasmid stability protein [Aquamicrobium lusatiense]
MKQVSASGGPDKYTLRLPDGMRTRIRERAVANKRSMNSEIIHVLDCAIRSENEKGPAEAATSPSHITHQPG